MSESSGLSKPGHSRFFASLVIYTFLVEVIYGVFKYFFIIFQKPDLCLLKIGIVTDGWDESAHNIIGYG